ncbi:lipopolysaccharide biosynthesis protein [Pedobacter helvus]|uniref:Lipopolysaccharide biosynthesis protein n=1 Tax=Pedobacter helvus TaxID=2563444 RepID=A0ABW9JDM1_9SPHI|nr:oligosaccharide flippase family protein [Pedobacter ureilyticus]
MKNKLINNIIFYGLGDFLVTAITAFLLLPVYISNLTTDEYGIFNIVNNNTIIFTYIFQFGIISAFSRLLFSYKDDNESYISSVILFHVISSVVIFTITYLFSDLIFGVLSPSIQKSKYVYIPVLIGFSTFIPNLYYALLRANQKARSFFLFQILTVGLLLGLVFYFIFFSRLSLQNLFISLLVTNLIMLLLISFFFYSKIKFRINYSYIKSTLKLSFPIFLGYIAYFFISRYSIIILQKHITLKELGTYTFAQQIAMVPTLLAAVIGKAVQPYLFSSANDDEFANRSSQADGIYKIFLFWSITGLIFFIEDIFMAILPQNYIASIPLVQSLLAVNLIFNLYFVESSILLYRLKSGLILFITITGSVVNVILCQLLVSKYKIDGAILAMFIAFTITLALQIFFSRKHILIDYKIKEIAFFVLVLGVFLFLFNGIKISSLNQFRQLFKILSFGVLTLILFMSLKKSKNYFYAEEN